MKEYDYEWVEVTRTKEVLVFGKKLIVPTFSKYITVDEDGSVFGWGDLPIRFNFGYWEPEGGSFYNNVGLGKIKMKPEYNWTTMIVEV